MGVGSNSNAGEHGLDAEEERAVVWEIDAITGAHWTLARSVCNPTSLAIETQARALWLVANERDELGPQLGRTT